MTKPRDIHLGLSVERLRFLLDYNPGTGGFKWRNLPHKCASSMAIGGIAGAVTNGGYRQVTIDGKKYLMHRLAWLYVYGEWPSDQIDHEDCNKLNNAIRNLREAASSDNRANTMVYASNELQIKGVQIHKQSGKYRARIFWEGKHISLGLFETSEEAAEAYRAASIFFFGEFARAA